MNNLQRICAAAVLTITLTAPISAGVMDCPVAPPTPPTSPMTQGDIHTGSGATTEGGAWSEVVWGVVEGVLALL